MGDPSHSTRSARSGQALSMAVSPLLNGCNVTLPLDMTENRMSRNKTRRQDPLSFRPKWRNLLLSSILQHVHAQVEPAWVKATDQGNFLCARPFFQLSLPLDRIANVPVILVVNQFLAAIIGRKRCSDSFAVFPSSPRQAVGYANVENGMIAVRNDVNPEVIVT